LAVNCVTGNPTSTVEDAVLKCSSSNLATAAVIIEISFGHGLKVSEHKGDGREWH